MEKAKTSVFSFVDCIVSKPGKTRQLNNMFLVKPSSTEASCYGGACTAIYTIAVPSPTKSQFICEFSYTAAVNHFCFVQSRTQSQYIFNSHRLDIIKSQKMSHSSLRVFPRLSFLPRVPQRYSSVINLTISRTDSDNHRDLSFYCFVIRFCTL